MILFVSKDERELLERLRALGASGGTDVPALTAEVIRLKTTIADLQIDKSKITEEFEKRERELRHMVGLEKQRQEQEREQAKAELAQASLAAKLEVREENLAAEKARFAEQLEFNTERFSTMEKYLKDMMGDILKRLPNVNMEIKQKR